MSNVRHNCGLCVTHGLHDVYSFIKSLQHRGRDACGIAAIGNNVIDVIKWKGSAGTLDLGDLYNIFPPSKYSVYMAHVRYATRGRKDSLLEDAHPHVIGGEAFVDDSHILIRDCDAAIVHNGQINSLGDMYKENLYTSCDTKQILRYYMKHGEADIIRNIPGSYTLAIAKKGRKDVIVFRDSAGMKPGVLGTKDGKYCVSSEDIAFLKNGGCSIEDLDPGSVYYMGFDGKYEKKEIVKPKPAHCFFEWNYISHKGSTLNGVAVKRVREELGKQLFEEFGEKFSNVDVVTYIPRCPETSAIAYADKAKKISARVCVDKAHLKPKKVLYKLRSERSFLGSSESERKSSIDNNLHILPEAEDILSGKTVLCIDDSIIRGNNSRRAVDLLKGAGVKKLYLASYTPPVGIVGKDGIGRGCMYGVDMPPDDNFVARNRSVEEISKKMEVDVSYLSVEGMLKAFENAGVDRNNLCTYCIGGADPFRKEY